MKINLGRFYALMLAWTTLIYKCSGQTALLTLIDDKCITKTSSAMAMTYDLSDASSKELKKLSLDEVSQIKSMEKNTIEGLCAKSECFTGEHWSLENSLRPGNINNLVTDRRWEQLPTYITTSTDTNGDDLDYQSVANIPIPSDVPSSSYNLTIPFSLQAKEEAHIYLCSGDQVTTSHCYWFMLQAWSGAKTGFRICKAYEIQSRYDGRAPKGLCSDSTRQWKHDDTFYKFLTADRWTHFKIVKTGNVYNLRHENGADIFSVDTKGFLIPPRNVFFHSKKDIGLWKIHKFHYLYSERADADLESNSPLSFSAGQNCLAMFVIMCELCSMEVKLITYETNPGGDVLEMRTVNTQNEQWVEAKFIFNMKERRGNLFLRITPRSSQNQNNFWAFNFLRSCHRDEIRVLTPTLPKYWTKNCELVANRLVLETNSHDGFFALENWKTCKGNQFGEDCLPCELVFNDACPKKNKYCQLITRGSAIDHKCYCSIGYEGKKCKETCSSKYTYGHGCKASCKNCQDTCSKDPVFGKCDSYYCSNNYVGEKCDLPSGIYVFDTLPEIEIGPTSCNVSMISFSGKSDPRAPPHFYKYQYKQDDSKTWKEVTKEPLEFNVPAHITIPNLKIESIYSVRAFGFESEEDLNQLSHASSDIPVRTFTTKCNEINSNHLVIEPGQFWVKFWLEIDEESSKFTCGLSKYTFTFDNGSVEKKRKYYLINNLEPFTEYSINIKEHDNLLFTKSFRTKVSVPQEVQEFSYSKTSMPSALRFKWSRPVKSNGILLYYNIHFQLEKYLACKTSTQINGFDISLPASNEIWLQADLKPFAEYNIEIKANTSAGFGPPVSIRAVTDSAESVTLEEIPEFSSFVPDTDNVALKFDMVPCEKMSGPLYTDATITGTQSWCNHSETYKAQKIEINELVIEDLKPFCEYNTTIKHYRHSKKIEKEITSSFKTLESAPNEITELQVTAKSTDSMSLRWLPPSPPTGQLAEYKISYCFSRYWKRCNSDWNSFSLNPISCKLWPEFHCLTIIGLYENYVYTVKVQSKNGGNDKYSSPVEREKVKADDKEKSNAPYGVNMRWTEENYLNVTWYHPNATGGILTSFGIYVNGARHEYKIPSDDDYYLRYNTTIKTGLTFPDNYIVEVTARNVAGESPKAAVSGDSPPPIPDESIKKIDAKEESLLIVFENMKQYKNSFKRFLYVLITECGVCRGNLNSYKDLLVNHHKIHDSVKPIGSGQPPQWRTIKVYDDMTKYGYPRKLEIGKNTTSNIYTLKQNTNYTLAFIWVNRHERYVTMNYTIVTTGTASTTTRKESSTGSIFIIVIIVVILIAALIMTFFYIRLKDEVHKKLTEVFGCAKTSTDDGHLYENPPLLDEIPLDLNKNTRSSVHLRLMTNTICPGNPLFKTKNSRRIKLENLQLYVKNAIEANELCRQHELFPRGGTKSWTYGALPENKAKNRYSNLIAYNHSRVVLKKIEGDEYSDYINASYIDGYQSPRTYIATQGPKKTTVNDFWRMVWQERVSYIIMMANVYEGGKKKTEQYWPNNDAKVTFGDFTITFLSSEIHANYEYRKFKLHYLYGKPREVGQLHFKAWPDHGVPLYPQSLVPILEKMLTLRSEDFPLVVHCSAGVGRTGTVILCDICLRMAAAEGFVDALAMLEHLRNQRPNMVDNAEQYKLAHLVVLNCLMGLRTNIPINQKFAKNVEELFQKDMIVSQLQYIRSCEWEDDAMKTVSFMDDEEMPIFPEKNRFPNIIPDKAARVFLCPHPPSASIPSSTYINAVQVDGFCEPGRFIVTQFPLPDTVGDFWRLVAEKDISVIVCLNDIPSKDNSCTIFFPIKLAEFSPVESIKVKHVKNKNFQVYSILTFQMTVISPQCEEIKTTTIEIVKFRGWKVSQKVPDYTDFITFVEDVTNVARKSTPTLITCYDGATASGLFIAMSFLMEKIKLEQECDVCQAVRSIRNSRKQFTNTEEQLEFLYKASLLYVEEKFNQYSNMDLLR